MQVGDRLISKITEEGSNLRKYNCYYVAQVDKMYKSETIQYKITNYYVRPNGINITPRNASSWFFYDDVHYRTYNNSYIWDFFYTKQELRKEKLKKINHGTRTEILENI